MERGSILMVYSAMFGILVQFAAAQTVHVVGDSLGWDIPPNTSLSYPNWASGKTFIVGDVLVFNFMTNQHDIVRVPQASYEACTGDNAIGSIITTGPANITLDSAGDHYYICTFGRHCQAGQKLAITVSSSTGANPPMTAPPATPSPASSQPDACAPTPPDAPGPSSAPTPRGPPPPDSASASLAGSFVLSTIVSVGVAFVL